jgi:hypothetical protein
MSAARAWTVVALLGVAADAAAAERTADVRVRLRISDGAVAGSSESVRDIQDILREGKAEGVVEALPEGDTDVMLVVTHRFSGLPKGPRRGGGEVNVGSFTYNVQVLLVDNRDTVPLQGRGIVWRQAAVDLLKHVSEYVGDRQHSILQRRPDWPAVGFEFEPLTKAHEKELGVKGGAVLVTSVTPSGPAARGGLQVRDVVVKVAGRKVESAGDLARLLYLATPGQPLQLEISRTGSARPFTLSMP